MAKRSRHRHCSAVEWENPCSTGVCSVLDQSCKLSEKDKNSKEPQEQDRASNRLGSSPGVIIIYGGKWRPSVLPPPAFQLALPCDRWTLWQQDAATCNWTFPCDLSMSVMVFHAKKKHKTTPHSDTGTCTHTHTLTLTQVLEESRPGNASDAGCRCLLRRMMLFRAGFLVPVWNIR